MKKLVYLLLFSISLFSCSKSSNNEPKDEQLFDVSFNVSAFKQDITNMKSLEPLSEAIEILTYFVFNENDEFLYYKEFHYSNENFGNINDKLPEGTYNIIFFGHNGYYINEDDDDFFQGDDENQPTIIYEDGYSFKDSFHKKITINIPDDNIDMSVSLDRVVGKLEVVFTDNMPSEIKNLEYTLTGTYFGLDLYDTSPFHQESKVVTEYIGDDDKGKPNYKLELYSFVESSNAINCSITIKCFDIDNNVIASKNITNIDIFRNKITRLSGEMFSSTKDNENNFTLTVDTDWSEIIEKGFENGEGGKDETAPTVTFTSPSTNAASPTTITAGQTITFSGTVSDNQTMKLIAFSNLVQKTKSVSEFLQDFNEKLNAKKPNSASVLDKSELNVDFSIETLAGSPAGEYTLTCTVIDNSDNPTTKTFYIKVE
ncbi:hypothetical protein ACXR6G_11560 [Ancylomarina sp. YFZ004]